MKKKKTEKLGKQLEKLEAKLSGEVLALESAAYQKSSEAILGATSAQMQVFSGISSAYKFMEENPELSEDLEFLLSHGQEGIDKLPSRFRKQVNDNIAKIPEQIRQPTKATLYVLQNNSGTVDFVLPVTASQTTEPLGRMVYDSLMPLFEGCKEEASYKNGAIVFRYVNFDKEATDTLVAEVERKIEETNHHLEVESVSTGRWSMELSVPQLCVSELMRRYEVGAGTLYKAIEQAGMERVSASRSGKKRLFSPSQVAALDDYFREHSTKKGDSPQEPKQEPVQYLTVAQVADKLSRSKRRIYEMIQEGKLGERVVAEGRIAVSADAVDQFREEFLDANFVYRKK